MSILNAAASLADDAVGVAVPVDAVAYAFEHRLERARENKEYNQDESSGDHTAEQRVLDKVLAVLSS